MRKFKKKCELELNKADDALKTFFKKKNSQANRMLWIILFNSAEKVYSPLTEQTKHWLVWWKEPRRLPPCSPL